MNLNISPLEAYLSNVPRIPFYLSNIVAIYTILQKQYQQELLKIPRPTSGGGIPRSSFTSSEAGYKIVAYANVHSVVSEVISADSTPQDFHAAEAQAREILVYSILINESCCEAVGMGSGNVRSGAGAGIVGGVVGVGGAIESLERGMRGLMMGGSMGLEDDNGLGLLSSSPASNSSKGSSSSSKMMRMKEGILEDVGYFLSTVIGILRSYTDDIRHPSVMRLQDEVSYYLQSIEQSQGSGSTENETGYNRGNSSSYESGRNTEASYYDDLANQQQQPQPQSSEQLPPWSRPQQQRSSPRNSFAGRNTEVDSQRRQQYPPERVPSRNYPASSQQPHRPYQQYSSQENYDYRRPYPMQTPPRSMNSSYPSTGRQQGPPYSTPPRPPPNPHPNPPRYSQPPPSRYSAPPPPSPGYGSQQYPRHAPRQSYAPYSSANQGGGYDPNFPVQNNYHHHNHNNRSHTGNYGSYNQRGSTSAPAPHAPPPSMYHHPRQQYMGHSQPPRRGRYDQPPQWNTMDTYGGSTTLPGHGYEQELYGYEQDPYDMNQAAPMVTYIDPKIDPQGFEKLPHITRFLAHIRRQSMDVIFPQHLQNECMTCIYAAFKFHQVPVVHRVLMHTVSVLKESGLFYEGLKSLSKTKIRGVLSILKKAQIVMDYSGASSDMAHIQLSSEIDGYGRMHEWHDQLLLSYCQENHLYIPDDCMQEIVWRPDSDTSDYAEDKREGETEEERNAAKIEGYELMGRRMVEYLYDINHFGASLSALNALDEFNDRDGTHDPYVA